MQLASARNEETYKIACKQAEKDFENAQKQVTALEEEVVKALTGESQLDLSIANQMLLKHRGKLEAAQKAMDDAQVVHIYAGNPFTSTRRERNDCQQSTHRESN